MSNPCGQKKLLSLRIDKSNTPLAKCGFLEQTVPSCRVTAGTADAPWPPPTPQPATSGARGSSAATAAGELRCAGASLPDRRSAPPPPLPLLYSEPGRRAVDRGSLDQ